MKLYLHNYLDYSLRNCAITPQSFVTVQYPPPPPHLTPIETGLTPSTCPPPPLPHPLPNASLPLPQRSRACFYAIHHICQLRAILGVASLPKSTAHCLSFKLHPMCGSCGFLPHVVLDLGLCQWPGEETSKGILWGRKASVQFVILTNMEFEAGGHMGMCYF